MEMFKNKEVFLSSMAMHGYVGFLDGEEGLKGVDRDFKELVRLTYNIPGFGSYGVSCAGHFYFTPGEDKFYPSPWGHLGVATLPEMEHIPDFIKLLHTTVMTDPDAYILINDKKRPLADCDRYSPATDLKPYSIGQTNKGHYVTLLQIRISDNGCLDSVPEHYCSPIKLKGNEEAFEKSKQRSVEITHFWKTLEDTVRTYCQEHGLTKPDFDKPEFRPY